MRELTKLALSSLVLLAGLDPSVGMLRMGPAVEVVPARAVHGDAQHPGPHGHEVRARPGLSVPGHPQAQDGVHHRAHDAHHAGRAAGSG